MLFSIKLNQIIFKAFRIEKNAYNRKKVINKENELKTIFSY
jgi:hypothetical protein